MNKAVYRREFLRIGALALGGLSWPQIVAARAAEGKGQFDTSVIMLYLHGGPSQLETYDLKPDAPSSYRSVFRPIRTVVPGMEICEHFPRQSRVADRFSIVRSLHHDVGIHSDGGIIVLTGKRPSKLDPTSQSKSEHPDFGVVTSRCRALDRPTLPPYVTIPRKPYMTLPAYLGMHHGPFELGDPSSESFQAPYLQMPKGLDGAGLENRKELLSQFDGLRRSLDWSQGGHAVDELREAAFRMLTSSQVADAFDIQREAVDLRDKYGRNLWGQACLLARRLAEAGTAVVNLYIDTPKTGPEYTNWDDHILNAGRPGHFAEYMRVRLPYLDQALAALIEDIYDRGLDKKILVVVVGEFGRTPRLSHNANGTGRDHWPQAYSALFSGGGLRMGQVVGATNSKAEYPVECPYTPFDMLATIYRHLGIDFRQSFLDYSGRPVPILSDGAPIKELI